MPVVRQFEVYYGGFVYPQDGICLVNTGPGLLLSISPYNEASTPLLCCINLSEIVSDGHNLQVETLLSKGIIFSPLPSTYHKHTSGQNSATCSIQLLGIYTWKCSAYKNTCSLLIKWSSDHGSLHSMHYICRALPTDNSNTIILVTKMCESMVFFSWL